MNQIHIRNYSHKRLLEEPFNHLWSGLHNKMNLFSIIRKLLSKQMEDKRGVQNQIHRIV